MEYKKFEIINSKSRIEWIGRKVTGFHNGTVEIKKGELILNDGKLAGGQFVVDMTSINVLDITDSETKAQLIGHLTSDDFFSSQDYPEATLDIISVSGNYAKANLTIKGITHIIGFDASINVNGDLVVASAKLVIDRTKYDIKFRSGNFFQNLGDTLIYNDFELNAYLVARNEENISVL